MQQGCSSCSGTGELVFNRSEWIGNATDLILAQPAEYNAESLATEIYDALIAPALTPVAQTGGHSQ
jgi:hypothetical protein